MSYRQTATLRGGWLIAVAMTLLAAIPLAAGAQADSGNRPFVGTWKLDPAKSHMRGARQGFELFREYQDHGHGWMYHTVITVSPRGAGFLFAAARYDGKQYPVWDARLLGETVSDERKTPRTVEFDRLSAHQFRWTDRTNGKITQGGLCTVSADGKTLTITASGPGQPQTFTQVFDRIRSGVAGPR